VRRRATGATAGRSDSRSENDAAPSPRAIGPEKPASERPRRLSAYQRADLGQTAGRSEASGHQRAGSYRFPRQMTSTGCAELRLGADDGGRFCFHTGYLRGRLNSEKFTARVPSQPANRGRRSPPSHAVVLDEWRDLAITARSQLIVYGHLTRSIPTTTIAPCRCPNHGVQARSESTVVRRKI
jgi:hypothetical protein